MSREPSDAARWPSENQLHNENLIALPEVPDCLPTRRGRKVHIATIYRWVLKGVRGKVLESALLGGVRYTSLEALQRFMGTGPADLREQRRTAELRETLSRRGLLGRDANERKTP